MSAHINNLHTYIHTDTYTVWLLYRSVMILVAMQEHVHWELVLSVVWVNAALVSVSLKVQIQCVDLLLGHVTLKSIVVASLLPVQKIVTTRMDLCVVMIRPIATQESARPTMHSAKETLKLVGLCCESTVFKDYIMNNSTDKGINECFELFNEDGSQFGNCGGNGTHFVPCDPRCLVQQQPVFTCTVFIICNMFYLRTPVIYSVGSYFVKWGCIRMLQILSFW